MKILHGAKFVMCFFFKNAKLFKKIFYTMQLFTLFFKKNMQKPNFFFLMQMQKLQNFNVKNLLN